MGASGWEYVVSYQQDLGVALDVLRRQVFASGDFVKPSSVFDLPDPASVLWANGTPAEIVFWGYSGDLPRVCGHGGQARLFGTHAQWSAPAVQGWRSEP